MLHIDTKFSRSIYDSIQSMSILLAAAGEIRNFDKTHILQSFVFICFSNFQKVEVLFVQYDPAMAWNEKSRKLLFSHVDDFAAASKAFTEMFAVYDPRTGPKKSQEEDDEPLEFMTDDDGKLVRRSEQSKGSTRNSMRSVDESAPMSKLDEFMTDDNGKLIRTQRSSQSKGNTRNSVRSVNESAPMSKLDEFDDGPIMENSDPRTQRT